MVPKIISEESNAYYGHSKHQKVLNRANGIVSSQNFNLSIPNPFLNDIMTSFQPPSSLSIVQHHKRPPIHYAV
jgi:hypothetical protein